MLFRKINFTDNKLLILEQCGSNVIKLLPNNGLLTFGILFPTTCYFYQPNDGATTITSVKHIHIPHVIHKSLLLTTNEKESIPGNCYYISNKLIQLLLPHNIILQQTQDNNINASNNSYNISNNNYLLYTTVESELFVTNLNSINCKHVNTFKESIVTMSIFNNSIIIIVGTLGTINYITINDNNQLIYNSINIQYNNSISNSFNIKHCCLLQNSLYYIIDNCLHISTINHNNNNISIVYLNCITTNVYSINQFDSFHIITITCSNELLIIGNGYQSDESTLTTNFVQSQIKQQLVQLSQLANSIELSNSKIKVNVLLIIIILIIIK